MLYWSIFILLLFALINSSGGNKHNEIEMGGSLDVSGLQIEPIKKSYKSQIKEGQIIASSTNIADRYKLVEYIEELGVTEHQRFGTLLLLPSSLDTSRIPEHEAYSGIVILPTVRRPLNDSCIKNGAFCADNQIFHGGHGDVWRGYAINAEGILESSRTLVLKRMMVFGRDEILRCAMREIYFGELLRDENFFTELLAHFVTHDSSNENPAGSDRAQVEPSNIPPTQQRGIHTAYWLVFRDEGISLRHVLYALTAAEGVSAIYEPSLLWRRLRTTESGAESIRGIMFQLVRTVRVLHSRHMAHRDIKPSNLLLNSDLGEARLILGDFSSAVNAEALATMYGPTGPSEMEITVQYAPPESRLSRPRGVRVDKAANMTLADYQRYDVWSVGVVFLEILLGTDDVFHVDQRTAAMINYRLRSQHTDEAILHDALFLGGLADYCIYDAERYRETPGNEESTAGSVERAVVQPDSARCISDSQKHSSRENDRHHGHGHARNQHSCTPGQRAKSFANAVRKRDPLGLGVANELAIDLLIKLLQFDPEQRITMDAAMHHPFFSGGAGSGSSSGPVGDDTVPQQAVPLISIGTVAPNGAIAALPDPDWLSFDEDTKDFSTHTEAPTQSQAEVGVVFTCPKCQRTFNDWSSCNQHVVSRRHNESAAGPRCLYSSIDLPECISEHTLLPLDPFSGWCDLVGRRKLMEDSHSLAFGSGYTLYTVCDGHLGSRGSLWSSKFLPHLFERYLQESLSATAADAVPRGLEESEGESPEEVHAMSIHGQAARLLKLNGGAWDTLPAANPDEMLPSAAETDSPRYSVQAAANAMTQAFLRCSAFFVSQHPAEKSGSTAAVAVLFHASPSTTPSHLLVANAGDSRIIMCCTSAGDAYVLTVDHTPRDESERERILSRGAFVSDKEGIPRVNGLLAVTRAIGDAALASILTARPDVLVLRLEQLNNADVNEVTGAIIGSNGGTGLRPNQSFCGRLRLLLSEDQRHLPMFIILGSDGLFDVLTNNDATDLVCGYLIENFYLGLNEGLFQGAAKALAHEAFVRGSSDNIGVCVVGLGGLTVLV